MPRSPEAVFRHVGGSDHRTCLFQAAPLGTTIILSKRQLGVNKVPDILARWIIRAPQEARSWDRSPFRNAWDQLAAALRACGGTPVFLSHGRNVVDGREGPSFHAVLEDVEHPVDLCVFQQ